MIDGRVTSYDPASRTGQINDAEDNEYRFTMADWQSKGKPVAGTQVNFEPMSSRAYKITVTGGPVAHGPEGARMLAWIALVFAFFLLIGVGAQVENIENAASPEDLAHAARAASSASILILLDSALAGYAIGRGPKGRIVASLALGLCLLDGLASFGATLKAVEAISGVTL